MVGKRGERSHLMVFWSGSIATIYDSFSYKDSRNQSAPFFVENQPSKK
jgi:hypothetical protein